MKERIMVISPHPDDAELGMGGTIFVLKKLGYEVYIVDLTSGEPTPYGSEEKRKKETEEATHLMEIDERLNLGLPNRYLFDSKEARLMLAEKIRAFRPEILFCPHPEDAHPDHTAASLITTGARFYAKYTGISFEGESHYTPRLFFYFCSHLKKSDTFSFLVDTADQFDKKIAALKCYASQFIDNPKNRSVFEYIERRDSYFGSLIGKRYAEPFLSLEALGVVDPCCFLLK
ncbi:MAG: bacillithiol biosynthesis deacetylase BshB1 [Spirochaetota bacterium]